MKRARRRARATLHMRVFPCYFERFGASSGMGYLASVLLKGGMPPYDHIMGLVGGGAPPPAPVYRYKAMILFDYHQQRE